MSGLEQLYQQVIIDHARSRHGHGLVALDGAWSESHQVNPTCGDEVTLRVAVAGSGDDAHVASVAWEGQGCSISQASISVMHDLVVGRSVAEVEALRGTFRELLQTQGAGLDDDEAEELLGDATAFTGVGKFPARVKCALLGWSALADALNRTPVDLTIPTQQGAPE